MMMQSPSILTSQNPSLSLSRSQLQRRLQHRSLAPRGSTDRNAEWCITGRRVSCLSQLNSRSSHACRKAHYSPPRSNIAGSWTRGGGTFCTAFHRGVTFLTSTLPHCMMYGARPGGGRVGVKSVHWVILKAVACPDFPLGGDVVTYQGLCHHKYPPSPLLKHGLV
jgi:hypothetical protein